MFKPAKCPEDCVYRQVVSTEVPMCGYLFKTGQMRGCDPGPGCRRYVGLNEDLKHAKHRKTTWDTVKGKQMWEEGCSDSQIAKALGVKRNTVSTYRKRCWGEKKNGSNSPEGNVDKN